MLYTFQDVQTTLMAIQSHAGGAREFKLLVPEAMINDGGMTMAMVTDGILAQGWLPDGYIQKDGYRVYEYIEEKDAGSSN